ncbi:MAG: tetratricopeptide repeat protein, partial [Candidatus Hermodarchaeota archaeon]|nr:tetratricopeptide repeat protein [Candidatus Hermodarchaeota archaeon]
MMALERLNEAAGSFQQALVIDPDYIDAYYQLGLTLEKSGHKRKAIKYYQRAWQINPKYPGLRKKLDDLGVKT